MIKIKQDYSEDGLFSKPRCTTCGKTCLTRKQAAQVINMAHRTNKGSNIPKRAYYCHSCNSFHVTHLVKKNKQEAKYKKITKIPVRPFQVLLNYENSII